MKKIKETIVQKILEFFRSMFAPNITSKQFTTNLQDWAKGLFIAAATAPITVIGQSVEAGSFVFDWQMIAKVAFAGAISYIGKNFISKPAK